MNLFNLGEWKSAHRNMGVNFNTNVWSLIPDSYDDSEGSLFGVLDRNDGSSFAIDFSIISEGEVYDREWCESEYFARLYNACNSTKEIDRFTLKMGAVPFDCVAYFFENRQFGQQTIVRGIAIGTSSVIGLSMAWPGTLVPEQGKKVPPKHAIFLDEFELDVDLDK